MSGSYNPTQRSDNSRSQSTFRLITRILKIDSPDDLRSTDKPKPSSLLNIGATCYLNSAFQGLSACDTFVKDINDLCIRYPGGVVEQLRVFRELISILNGGSKRQMEISRNAIFRKWNKTGQQDSYEVLAYAMNEVYNEIRKHNEKKGSKQRNKDLDKWLKERLPMRFIMRYTIDCDCKLQSFSPMQSDLALHVVIPRDRKKYLLDELLDIYFEKDRIEDFTCDNSECKFSRATKYVRLGGYLPRTICIHLQRTYWNGYTMKKIDNAVEFGGTITIKPEYCFDYDRGYIDKYTLTSVIVHYGTVYGGHYVCYKRVGCNWFLTDDSSIRDVTEGEVFRCQAYILFYEQPYVKPNE